MLLYYCILEGKKKIMVNMRTNYGKDMKKIQSLPSFSPSALLSFAIKNLDPISLREGCPLCPHPDYTPSVFLLTLQVLPISSIAL